MFSGAAKSLSSVRKFTTKRTATMGDRVNNNVGTSSDNGAALPTMNIVREAFDMNSIIIGDSLHRPSGPETSVPASTNDNRNDDDDGDDDDNEAGGVVERSAYVAQGPKKASRKTPGRARQYLLADKSMFLAAAYADECQGEKDLLLQGHVLECPNKKTNDGRYKIDWEKNSCLPDGITPAMLRTWFDSTKEFRELLDCAIAKWHLVTSDEKKAQVQKKRKTQHAKQSTQKEKPGFSTPPARLVNLQARAMLMTEASTISSLSSRSGPSARSLSSCATSLMDRRPPRAPSPRNCHTAPYSDEDCATVTTATRTTRIESDSEDGSELDEEDNAYGPSMSDDEVDEEDEEEFRPHTEAPDLSVRARGKLGDYLRALQWKFEAVKADTVVPNTHRPYTGPEGIRPGVSSRFTDPMECFSECGGLNSHFIARLAANSNDYYYHHIKPKYGRNRYCNIVWKDMSIEEMYRFLGIMLKISLASVDGGGYAAYFAEEDKIIYADSGRNPRTISVANSKGWAQHIMSLNRFKQIRGSFHPEDKVASLGKDKCYQLRHALNQLNAAALSTFAMGAHMTFDEGGSACRSRRLHGLQAFKGMTCFEILHSDVGRRVWVYKDRAAAKEKMCSVSYGHPIVQELRQLHGLQGQQQRRKKRPYLVDDADEDYNANTEESQSQQATLQR